MDRRQFLKAGLGGLALWPQWRLWAASSRSDPLLLVVFLRGAYDSLSLLTPYQESFYYESRPTIAINKPDPNDPFSAIPLDADWALNPAVRDTLLPLYQSGELSFIPFAGTSFVSRSHFQAQDWVETAYVPGMPHLESGFLNRLVARLNGQGTATDGIGFTKTLPLILKGDAKNVVNTPLVMPKNQQISRSEEELWAQLYKGHALQAQVDEGLGVSRKVSQELQEEMQAASRSAIPAYGFASQAGRMGRFLRDNDRYKVAFVDVGGWDTHANQGNFQGALSNKLANLGQGLQELKEGLGNQWQNTTVVVLSEFGRTFRENGTKGTDHGHGTTMMVLGGGVEGGRVHGEQTRLRQQDLHENRDTPVMNDYKEVLFGIFKSKYGFAVTDLKYILGLRRLSAT